MSARLYRSVGITDDIDGYLFRTARRMTVHWTKVLVGAFGRGQRHRFQPRGAVSEAASLSGSHFRN
jgi:hypothetical protein